MKIDFNGASISGCAGCFWYSFLEKRDDNEFGNCWFNPPSVVVVDNEPFSLYPEVEATARCSKWASVYGDK